MLRVAVPGSLVMSLGPSIITSLEPPLIGSH